VVVGAGTDMTPVAIYKITNKENGKFYIGQSIRPEKRFAEHSWKCSGSVILKKAFAKYGKEAFSMEILVWCQDKNYADRVEKALISSYETREKGYNIAVGGEGNGFGEDHPWYGGRHTEETKKKLSDQKRGKNNHMWGKENTPEQKAKISETLKNRKITWGDKISAAKKGIVSGGFSNEELRRRALLAGAKVARKVIVVDKNISIEFSSIRQAAEHFNVHEVTMQRYLREGKKSKWGWKISYLTSEPNA